MSYDAIISSCDIDIYRVHLRIRIITNYFFLIIIFIQNQLTFINYKINSNFNIQINKFRNG